MTIEPDLMLDIRRKRMERIDALPPDVRALVHEFGWTVVGEYWSVGVRKASVIRHLIEITLNGAHEIQDRRLKLHGQSFAGQAIGKALQDLGVLMNGEAVARRLRVRGGVALVMEPTPNMVAASMNALSKRPDRVWPREKKHRVRLRDAIAAAVDESMPQAD